MRAANAIRETARRNHVSEKEVREEMELCIRLGQTSPDPAVRARWDAIPRRGKTLTVEELVDYLAKKAAAKQRGVI